MRPLLRRRRSTRGIDLAPLLDIVLVLLLFVVAVASYKKLGFTVDLPSLSFGNELGESLILTIDQNGSLRLNEKALTQDELLKKLAADDVDEVLIAPSKKISVEVLFSLIELVKESGVESIQIAHDKK